MTPGELLRASGRRVAVLVALCALAGCRDAVEHDARRLSGGGDPGQGRLALRQHGCGSCHVIPGVEAADGKVGPPLEGVASRLYLAGRVTNTPENLMRWVRHPQQVEPGTAMPELGLSEDDVRNIAAYLYTLR